MYFTFDGHGSTRVLTDLAGAIAELYAFDAYGNAIGFDPSVALTEFLYSGEQFDSKIGQQYLRARYYDPATGRFNRLDPFFGNLNDPQSLHNYLYCHAEPTNNIDPSGNIFLPILVLLGGTLLGAGVGAYLGYERVGTIFSWEALVGGLVGAAMATTFLYAPGIWSVMAPTGVGAVTKHAFTKIALEKSFQTFFIRCAIGGLQSFAWGKKKEALFNPSVDELRRISSNAMQYNGHLAEEKLIISLASSFAANTLQSSLQPDLLDYVMKMSFSQLGPGINMLLFASDVLSFTASACDYVDGTMNLLVLGINHLPQAKKENFLDFIGYPEGIASLELNPDFLRMAFNVNSLCPEDEIRLIGLILQNLDADNIQAAASDTNTLFKRMDKKYGELLINGNPPK